MAAKSVFPLVSNRAENVLAWKNAPADTIAADTDAKDNFNSMKK